MSEDQSFQYESSPEPYGYPKPTIEEENIRQMIESTLASPSVEDTADRLTVDMGRLELHTSEGLYTVGTTASVRDKDSAVQPLTLNTALINSRGDRVIIEIAIPSERSLDVDDSSVDPPVLPSQAEVAGPFAAIRVRGGEQGPDIDVHTFVQGFVDRLASGNPSPEQYKGLTALAKLIEKSRDPSNQTYIEGAHELVHTLNAGELQLAMDYVTGCLGIPVPTNLVHPPRRGLAQPTPTELLADLDGEVTAPAEWSLDSTVVPDFVPDEWSNELSESAPKEGTPEPALASAQEIIAVPAEQPPAGPEKTVYYGRAHVPSQPISTLEALKHSARAAQGLITSTELPSALEARGGTPHTMRIPRGRTTFAQAQESVGEPLQSAMEAGSGHMPDVDAIRARIDPTVQEKPHGDR